MSSEWIESEEKLNGKKAICHCLNADDIQLCGKNGVIWKYGPNTYKALIDNHKLFNRMMFERGDISRKAVKGDESIILFKDSEFEYFYKALKIPRNMTQQIQFSKRFSQPL